MSKRFSDAELAAEYWGADVGATPAGVAQGQVETILRFATLPHFDEVVPA